MRLAAFRSVSIAAAIVLAPVATAFAAQSGTAVPKLPASSWKPQEPVEFLVQSAAGGGSDIFARSLAKVLTDEKIVTVPINVVNKPGGSGAVAYSHLNQKKGDPHIIATATGSYITTPIQGHSPVSYKNFTNLAVLCVEDYVGVVRADSPYKSLKDLIAAAKKKPNSIRVGGSGPSGSDAIIRHRLEKVTGAKLNYIVFQSGGEVNAALLGGTVDFASPNPSEATELIKAKRLRALAMFSPERLDKWKDVPTAKEQGIDVTLDQFRGVVAAGGLTKDQALFWQNAMVKLFQSPGFKKYLDENGLRPLLEVGDDAEKYLAEQTVLYTEILTELGVVKKK
ncbi:MAG: tripartite tricarboxylate transporter substrate binding protein [Betaproteobacteria bacterium]|nr:tripartite tricarboxylate transporter substrate binding protein [Betaproteobacteria bacterium]